MFIYSYFFLAMRRYLGLKILSALIASATFIALNMRFEALWRRAWPDVSLEGSVGYVPAVLAMIGVGVLAGFRAKRTGREELRHVGRDLLIASALFALSLAFRSVDRFLCPAWPWGTHGVWHGLNAVVLYLLTRTVIAYGTPQLPSEAGSVGLPGARRSPP